MKTIYIISIMLFVISHPCCVLAETIAQNLSAECRNGQVFITWTEAAENNSNVRVYMSGEPIAASNLAQAQLLTSELQPQSARDWYEDSTACPKASGQAGGWIIENGGEKLPINSGIFVHTVLKNDPNPAFFAVLGEKESGDDIKTGENMLEKAVELKAGEIDAIAQKKGEIRCRENMPLALYLHSHTSRPSGELTHLIFGDAAMGWREGLPFKFKVSVLEDVVLVEPYDRVWINRVPREAEASQSYDRDYKNIESWWYGTTDKISSFEKRAEAIPTNYTERVLLKIIDWVERTYKTDSNRVYGFGASMGSGIQRFALYNPQRFASVDVLVPIVDVGYEIEIEEGNIKRQLPAFGSLDRLCSDQMMLRDRFNLVGKVCESECDLPFIVARFGRADFSVGWKRKPDYIACMQQQRHGILAGWDNGNHSNSMRKKIEGFPDFRDYKWHIERFALNMSYPAFSNFSLNDNMGNGSRTNGDIEGFINYGLDWRVLKDDNSRYEILITKTQKDFATVDVTPRRRQMFKPAAGQKILAINETADGKTVERTTLTADADGRITYKGFKLSEADGNKLILAVRD